MFKICRKHLKDGGGLSWVGVSMNRFVSIKVNIDSLTLSVPRRLKRHQNKVKVEGFCLNISYLA